MNKNKIIFILIFIVFFVSITIVFSENLSSQETTNIIAQADQNLSPSQFESFIIMKNYKPGKDVVQTKAHCYRKNDKMVAIFIEPASQKGQAFIRNGDDMWMYLPKSEKLLRIGAKDNSMGGEISNADLMRLDLVKDYSASYIGDETIDNIVCYKLELTAKKRTVAYDKVIYWVSKDNQIPIKREYYSISGKKLKSMFFHEIKMLGDKVRPTVVETVNEENNAYKSELIYQSLVSANLNDNIFNPAYVKRLQ